MQVPNKFNNYAVAWVDFYCPKPLIKLYSHLLEISTDIQKVETRIKFARHTNTLPEDLRVLNDRLNALKGLYSNLQAVIIEQKKRLKLNCSWEKANG